MSPKEVNGRYSLYEQEAIGVSGSNLKDSYLVVDRPSGQSLTGVRRAPSAKTSAEYVWDLQYSTAVDPQYRTELDPQNSIGFSRPTEKVDIQTPKQVVARDLTQDVKRGLNAEADSRLATDLKSMKMRFFTLDLEFGIQPSPEKQLTSVEFKTTLEPACSPSDRCLCIYDIAPGTSREVVAEYDGEVETAGGLAFRTPGALAPWLSATAEVRGRALYTTHLKFSKAIVTSSTNGNNMVSWSFKKSKTTGEDPRGAFRLAATLGVPGSYGKKNELKQKIKATVIIKAKVDDVFYKSRKVDISVPIRFE